jgi:putative (di)nucleoside polyphosphate hydrolase
MPASDLPYRPCVGVMLVNPDGLIWVGRRTDTPNGWQMPQGGVDHGESPADAALRELHEEIGTDKAEIVAESQALHRYDLPEHLLGKVWGGRYRGQEQRWFLLRFLGGDDDINIATAHPEFDAWKWVPLDELCERIVPFKRDVYRQVIAEFEPLFGQLAKGRNGSP